MSRRISRNCAPRGFRSIRNRSNSFDLRELTGRDAIKADFQLDYRVDPERKTMMLNRLELDLRELARIELSLALDGIDPPVAIP